MPPMTPTATISARGEKRLQAGHPWIYRTDVVDVQDAAPGETVTVLGPRARVVGQALFSDQSQITLRMLTRGEAPADLGLWGTRLQAAVAFRESLQLDATAYR